MNHPTLATLIVVGVFALIMINSAVLVHAQSTLPVPPPPTTPIIPVLPRVQPPVLPAVAQPCVNNGTNVLGPNDNGKQILNQENQCTGTPKNVNQAPIANAGPDQTITPLLGTTVTLDGTASFAQNGATIVSYQWTQTSGTPVSLNGATTATPTFTAPTVTTSTALTFSLIVADSNGVVSAPDSVTITLNPSSSNQPPVAIATTPSQVVSRGSTVTLDGTGSFSPNGGTIVAYSWSQTAGPSVGGLPNTARPVFVAPQVSTTLAFSLTVTDSRGAVSSPSSPVFIFVR